jgi:hypothetical protein
LAPATASKRPYLGQMPILNYTTAISTSKTAQEITGILVKAGAQKIVLDYAEGEATAITFAVPVGPESQLVFFTLPANWRGVQKALLKSTVPAKYCTDEQARRTAWRIIKTWCEAQLALIEAGQAGLAEIFLPYAQTPSGATLYQAIEAGNFKQLGN